MPPMSNWRAPERNAPRPFSTPMAAPTAKRCQTGERDREDERRVSGAEQVGQHDDDRADRESEQAGQGGRPR